MQVHPGPLVTSFPLTIPGTQVQDTTLAELENDCSITRVFNSHKRSQAAECGSESEIAEADRDMDRCLLKLFNHLVKNDRPGRALELTASMNLDKSVEGVVDADECVQLLNSHGSGQQCTSISASLFCGVCGRNFALTRSPFYQHSELTPFGLGMLV